MLKHLSVLLLVAFSAALASAQTCSLITSFTTKKRLISNNPNSLKLFDVSVNEGQGKAWISPIMNPYLTSINLNTLSEGSDSLPVEIVGNSPTNVKFILVNPYNGFICVNIGGENTLKLYNPTSSSKVGTYTFSGFKGGIEVDATNNQILICDGANIKFLSGSDLSSSGASINFGIPAAGVMVDNTNAKIWATSKDLNGGNVVLKKYNLNSHALENTYNIAATEVMGVQAIDPGHGRLILGGLTQIKDINLSNGSVTASYSIADNSDDYAYSNALQTLFITCSEAYAAQGVHGKWSKRYEIDLTTGTTNVVNQSGDKVSRLAVDNTRGLLIEPNMHHGTVRIKNLTTSAQTTIDVGDSADQMCISGNTVFCINRLGGSKITAWNATTNDITGFDAGVWPCVNLVDDGLGNLFVLNHFTSSIQRRSAATFGFIDSLLLGVDECRDDAISTMFLDAGTHRLYVVFPELSTLVVANGQNMSVEATIDLSGWFSYNGAGGLGDLQVVAGAGKIFVFDKYSHKLARYNATTYADEGNINLSTNWTGQSLDEAALAWDDAASRVICGDLLIKPMANWTPFAAIEMDLNAGGVFAGYNAEGNRRVFITQNTGGQVTVKFLDATTNAVTSTQNLFTFIGAPSFCLDRPNNRLFFGEFTTSKIWHYAISSTPLPVEMTGFDANYLKQEHAVQLLWDVAAEQNIAQYVVERNRDESDPTGFAAIGAVTATGKSGYSFYDAHPQSGWNYYRLRVEERDGSFSYEPVRAVLVADPNAPPAPYPNPVTAVLKIKGDYPAGYFWRIFDISGRRWMESEGDITAGIDVSGLPGGVYLLEMTDQDGRVDRARFVKE
jgi:hypothetical protein